MSFEDLYLIEVLFLKLRIIVPLQSFSFALPTGKNSRWIQETIVSVVSFKQIRIR